ncbi:hypothetical protein MP228_000642 [Amoeboaphelidium protococcarum]|nr:hypothetical protein MP228_000642 [Amoeboaphelidium protococcarum]
MMKSQFFEPWKSDTTQSVITKKLNFKSQRSYSVIMLDLNIMTWEEMNKVVAALRCRDVFFNGILNAIRVRDELNREQLEFLETLKEEEDVDIEYQMRRYYLFATRSLALAHNLKISESVTAKKLRYKAKDTLKEEYRDIYLELAFCERVDDQIELWINAVVMVVANFK